MQIRFSKTARRLALSTISAAVLATLPGLASAQYTSSNRDVLVPNTGAWPTAGVTLNGTTFVNLGLQGVGRVAANSIDSATGETLGSISDMQITGFTNNGNGSWSGTFNFLPDRGYNSGATFSNYAARINTFSFTFTPYTAAAPTAAQNQIAMAFTGSTRFTYDHDNNPLTAPVYTTGLLASGTAGLFGTTVPTTLGTTTQSDGTITNRLTLDAEGLILDNRAGMAGSGWVGDEYGAYIYRFNTNKQLIGQLQLPAALVPHAPVGTINFATDPPANGRRINQGMEGIAQSPDGTKLFGLLQSATIQDSGAGNQGRSNARLVVYDISASDTPAAPMKEYVIQLPRVDDNGGTAAVNRTAAQSSIIALNDHQLLILSRDGNGRGASGSPVFKSILLADISNATVLTGLGAEGAQVAPGGVLSASVSAIQWTEALNMLGKLGTSSALELAKFGLNIDTAPGNSNSLSEKWEALGLVPVGDGSGQYFLFVGNDNDFLSSSGKLLDANGVLQSYNAGLENDTMVLAYRVAVVPEPETYGLMLAGLALVGVVARRRKPGV
ncbi:MAG: esterase-like activity of phytase family protein [Propionivibrio sp.]|uniref:esterase-like activity of phytase family protein n=1 Tax=Propionivibrio sp. TaxID=2212460 RepID=UPI001A424CE7|nr:esterase-like activity of phytase family protein [Propionivibrio sp.]MBL8415721.1 esterase-like activity of phytase family protein [Propionivibrio sp.]